MGKESEKGIHTKKFNRLPKGIRKRIRRMKEAGEVDEAFAYRSKFIQKEASKRLNGSLKAIEDIQDTVEIRAQSIKVFWLMHAAGEIDFDERFESIKELYDGLSENEAGLVTNRWKELREDIKKLMPRSDMKV